MHSCVSLVHFGVGEVQLNDMRVENALLAPFLYFAFVLLVVLIMINMFLAIINDAYRQVIKERHTRAAPRLRLTPLLTPLQVRSSLATTAGVLPAAVWVPGGGTRGGGPLVGGGGGAGC